MGCCIDSASTSVEGLANQMLVEEKDDLSDWDDGASMPVRAWILKVRSPIFSFKSAMFLPIFSSTPPSCFSILPLNLAMSFAILVSISPKRTWIVDNVSLNWDSTMSMRVLGSTSTPSNPSTPNVSLDARLRSNRKVMCVRNEETKESEEMVRTCSTHGLANTVDGLRELR